MKPLQKFAFTSCILLLSCLSANAQENLCFAGKSLPIEFAFVSWDTADFDDDGDVDLAVVPFDSGQNGSQIVMYLNDGEGNFTELSGFGNSADAKRHIVATDVDGDSDVDIVVANEQGTTSSLAILRNNGDATFGPETFITNLPKISFLDHHDLDDDSDSDLVLISNEQVVVLENQGNGDFTTSDSDVQSGAFFQQVVFEDYDGDQNLDLAVTNAAGNEVLIYLGNGDMTFSNPFSTPTEGGGGTSLVPIDYDGDQDIDLVVEVGNELAVLRNNGDSTFTNAGEIQRFAAYDAILYAEDFDSDNDLDIFDGLSWHINDNGSFQSRVDVVSDRITIGLLADVDTDGDRDVLFRTFNTSGAGSLATLRNNGDGSYETITDYDQDNLSSFLLTTDLNGDSLPDIVNLDRQADLLWYQLNQGDKTFGAEVVVSVGSSPRSVAHGDIDGDGDCDLVVANGSGDSVSVLIQNASGQFNVEDTLPAGDRPERVVLEDFDGDGDVDMLVGTRINSAAVGIFVNNSGTFAPMQVIAELANPSASKIAVADFDGDADLDFVFSHSSNSELRHELFLNDGNAGFTNTSIHTGPVTSAELYAADVNGDQNEDIVQARLSGGLFFVLFGNGDGTFQSPVDVGDDILARNSQVCDVDGDQDIDLIARVEGAVIIFENVDGVLDTPQWFAMTDEGNLGCADFDGDSKIDLLGQNERNFSISYSCIQVHNLADHIVVGGGDTQRSMVTEINVTFGSSVEIASGAFELIKRGDGGGVVDMSMVVDDSDVQPKVTLTFPGAFTEASGSLVDGNYQLTINGDFITAGGLALDVDGDGTPGGVLVFGDLESDAFYRLFADSDQNRVVNIIDLLGFRQTYQLMTGDASFDKTFDWNLDGVINVFDLLQFRRNYLKEMPFADSSSRLKAVSTFVRGKKMSGKLLK